MTLRSLEVFLAVVESGSMRAAAEQLYISQPSVSGVVADLENEFGVRLFERMGKRLFITQEGQQLAGYARRMLSLNGEIIRQMRTSGSRMPLRIGASVTVGSSILPQLVQSFKETPPYVFVGTTGVVEQKLLRNELDVALVEGRIKSEDLLVSPVLRDRLALICTAEHPLAARNSVCLADLGLERLILREPESGTRQILDLEFQQAGVPMNVGWECTNSQAILNAVRLGLGVALLSPRLLREGDGLVAVPVEDDPAERWFSLALHKDKYIRPALQTFLDACRNFK